MNRLQHLQAWLRLHYPGQVLTLTPASSDASFRRYFRVSLNDQTFIVMDAPPPQENCAPFLHAAEVFARASVAVPEIVAHDLQQGFMLLSDLGNTTYLQALTATPETANALYKDAIDILIKLQQASTPAVFPDYDRALLRQELQLFPEWYLTKQLGVDLNQEQKAILDTTFELILASNLAQPRVYVHRDYHSRNLMVSTPNPGVLDFQDAVFGPITYDLVSLLKDAYIWWEEEQILEWTIRYWETARKAGLPVAEDFSTFYLDFEWMGVQRHLKVLGIFARLCHRDHKNTYLKDMPTVMRHLRKTCERYRELHPLFNLLNRFEQVTPQTGYTF
ncbi:MAG: phosphotransferase [Nitrosomonas sp.]|nr:phosphotransferase [Nitrosomonas sp.]